MGCINILKVLQWGMYFLFAVVFSNTCSKETNPSVILGIFDLNLENGLSAALKAYLEAAELIKENSEIFEEVKLNRFEFFKKNETENVFTCHKAIYNCPKADCSPIMETQHNLVHGIEVEERRCDKKQYIAVVKLEGNNKVTKDYDFGTFKCLEEMTFDEDGFTFTGTCKDKTDTEVFKRV